VIKVLTATWLFCVQESDRKIENASAKTFGLFGRIEVRVDAYTKYLYMHFYFTELPKKEKKRSRRFNVPMPISSFLDVR